MHKLTLAWTGMFAHINKQANKQLIFTMKSDIILKLQVMIFKLASWWGIFVCHTWCEWWAHSQLKHISIEF